MASIYANPLENKESVCIRKEFNSQGTGLGHQHGRRFIVLGHHAIWPPWRHVKTLYNITGWPLHDSFPSVTNVNAFSLRKHPFLLALRRLKRPQRRRARRNGCFRRLKCVPRLIILKVITMKFWDLDYNYLQIFNSIMSQFMTGNKV